MFRWHTSAFIQNLPLYHMKEVLSHSQEKKHHKEYLFFLRVHIQFQQLHLRNTWQRWYFWSIFARAKTCKCVYFEQSIYTDIFPNTFYRLWRVGIVFHTHASHPRMLKNNNNQNMGPEFSCCHFFFSLFVQNQNLRSDFSTLLILHHHCAAATSRHQSVTLFTELL